MSHLWPDEDTEAYRLMEDILINDILGIDEEEQMYNEAMALIERGIWVQKDGSEIHIKDMTGRHIRNAVAMIDRNMEKYDDLRAEIAEAWRKALKDELGRRYRPVDPAFAWG